jgi:hypothetical protein
LPEFIGRRQIIDIPPIKPEYTEHQIYRKTCSCATVWTQIFFIFEIKNADKTF